FFYCISKRVFVPAPDNAGPDPLAALWRLARNGQPSAEEAREIACLGCDERDRCYPASGPSRDPGTAGARRTAGAGRPWSGRLVEPVHDPFSAWLRLASGESWPEVRASVPRWPKLLCADLDRLFAGFRPTILGTEHGSSFALETFLLRLEWLRQALSTVRDL